MSAEKITAVVVSLIPWRETSYIVKLFTKEHGMISVCAKGIRSKKNLLTPIDRGQLADALVYIRHVGSLGTAGEIQITEYYPSIRESLGKTALRDIALELIIKTIRDAHSHPELYDRIILFLSELESAQNRVCCFFALWHFMFDMMKLLGFGITAARCLMCGDDIDIRLNGGFFVIESGGVVCRSCAGVSPDRNLFIQPEVLSDLSNLQGDKGPGDTVMQKSEMLRLTKLFVSYCRIHCEIGQEFRAVTFLEEVL